MSSAETKLANLLISLREGAATANQIADNIEKALLAMYEQEGAMPSEPAQKPLRIQEMLEEETVGNIKNKNIIDLITCSKFNWDMSAENIIDLKDYCFVEIVAKSATNVGFKFISSALGKVVITQNYDPVVYEALEVGKIYVCHNVRKGRKLYWDGASNLTDFGLNKEQCISKAKALARIFAEQK